jgi:hypothetical protein
MQPNKKIAGVVDDICYDTSTATLLAGDDYWDGHNYERRGYNTFLYRTPQGQYFTVTQVMEDDEEDYPEPVTEDEAVELYEDDLPNHWVPYEEAFPNVEVEDA